MSNLAMAFLRNSLLFRVVLRVTASLAIIVAGGVTFYVFGQKPEIQTKDNSGLELGVLVETLPVDLFDSPVTIQIDGEAATYRVVEIATEVSGRIAYKSEKSRSGHFVEQGELLFKIDDESYRIAVESQQAQLNQIREEIHALNVTLDNLSTLSILAAEDLQLQRNQLERTQRLYKDKAASDTELDSAKQQELVSRNALQKLRNELNTTEQNKKTEQARLQVAAVALKRAELDLSRCSITASISGRIVDDYVEQGNYVASGKTLTHLSDASRMEVRCQLLPIEIAWIWEQQVNLLQKGESAIGERIDPIELQPVPCEVVYEFEGVETIWTGSFTRFAGSGLSRETRTFPARVIVEHPQHTRTRSLTGAPITVTPPTLLSGMFVSVRIPVTLSQPFLKVPLEAIRPGGKIWIFEDKTLNIVHAPVARIVGDHALLRPEVPVSAGDKVIVSPISSVIQGMPVREESNQIATLSDSVESLAKDQR